MRCTTAIHAAPAGQIRHTLALEAADTAEMRHFVVLEALQKDGEIPRADVVANDEVGIQCLPPSKQVCQQSTL